MTDQTPTAAPAAPVAPAEPQKTDMHILIDWQAAQLKELKSINGKLGFFVFLALCAIGLSFLQLIFH